MISFQQSFLDASLFENCYCFKYKVVCSQAEFNKLSKDVEGVIIGNECMTEETEIDFSGFIDVRMIDVGYDSLTSVDSLNVNSMMIIE